MPVLIRPARDGDKKSCLLLINRLVETVTGESSPENAEIVFHQLLEGSRGQVLVAEDDNNILGLAALSYNLAMRYGGEYCNLEELIVSPQARGKNVGILLMDAAIEAATAHGCFEMGVYLVETTQNNLPFYQKCGFKKVGTELRRKLG